MSKDDLGPLLAKHGIVDGFDGGLGLRYRSHEDRLGNYVVRSLICADIAAVIEDVVAAERERWAQFCEQHATMIGALLADEIRRA